MKLTPYQFETQISKKISPLYIFSGEELLLKQEAIALLRKHAQTAGYQECLRLTPETGWNWETLYTTLYSPSLLAPKQFIELDLRECLPTKTGASILEDYAKNLTDQQILLLNMEKLEQKVTKTAWFQAVDKQAISVTFWPINREQLPAWIKQRAKKYGLTLAESDVAELSTYTEGNLLATAQAIEKLALLGKGRIQEVLSDHTHFTIFDLSDSVLAGEPARALRILNTLQAEGVEPVLILWSLTRELRSMADLAGKVKQGIPLTQLFEKQRIYPRRQKAIRQFLTTHSQEICWQRLSQAFDIDRVIKGVLPGNVWDSLQTFCVEM